MTLDQPVTLPSSVVEQIGNKSLFFWHHSEFRHRTRSVSPFQKQIIHMSALLDPRCKPLAQHLLLRSSLCLQYSASSLSAFCATDVSLCASNVQGHCARRTNSVQNKPGRAKACAALIELRGPLLGASAVGDGQVRSGAAGDQTRRAHLRIIGGRIRIPSRVR